ncbi:MAG: hypothetical protein JWR19_2221 [Pedosphaera sp.]|nr:hypothetical protein [Pedosphaera sp.]
MQRDQTRQDEKRPAIRKPRRKVGVYNRVFNTPKGLEFDEARDRVRGLWEKQSHYYAQLNANDGKPHRYKLDHAKTIAEAQEGAQVLKFLQKQEELFPPGQEALTAGPTKLTVAEGCTGYRSRWDTLKKKDPSTYHREDSSFKKWTEKFGNGLLAGVNEKILLQFAEWRTEAHGVGGRAIDLDVLHLNHVVNWGITMAHLPKDHPRWVWKSLAEAPSKDDLLTPGQTDELCNAALLDPKVLAMLPLKYRHLRERNVTAGQSFHDYLRLLQHSGGREHETCLQEWTNVTWTTLAKRDGDGGPEFKKGEKIPGNLFFPGANAKAGGGESAEDRRVPFHAALEDHLLAMHARSDPANNWMFPGRDATKPISRFNKQLDRVKSELREAWEAKASAAEREKFQWFDYVTFQWFRHYFISHCVMAGIDYKTIAVWVSHRDGGVLIGRLYGHLDPTHGQKMAGKLDAHLA